MHGIADSRSARRYVRQVKRTTILAGVTAVFLAACNTSRDAEIEATRETVATGSPVPANGVRVNVPSDPKASYFVIDEGGTPDLRTLTTRRVGPSGTSFARREFDCRKRTWRYLAEGDTLDAMTSANAKMATLVAGSIADVMWHRACSQRAVEKK